MVDPSVAIFGPLDTLVAPYLEYAILALAVLNFVSRRIAHAQHVTQAADGPEALSRHWFHSFTTWGLVITTLYYLTLHHHAGMVLSVLVLGVFFADFFEFEARKVEARDGRSLERPKGALVAATFMLLYVAYLSLFFIVKPLWTQVV
ncbi:DUF7313 family protein [Halobacterium salinarum]|uniref:DUF7313 domain-containing protein n=4 Tax=Halobacterium salinarum TaxID=2242 RepID=Q9HRR6_HALSA|nr:hypothetical protein [Halobacterium salinarum]AAG19092.1 hypothetical protein VNG_0578H [Halobacterium salinarum NRC-1]MBB6089930.1 hypothetical protein [Halobacterium salinarum]MDL0120648.1 hypothetical protein [Halobacterium salinarum]MDL0123881.1 hypothetical protein [Halobacterium salinarum]MDL0126812.1 hypothetical protein [Halobacterium salinarum]